MKNMRRESGNLAKNIVFRYNLFQVLQSFKEATGMDDERIMAIYDYQYAMAEDMVARKKDWKKECN